MKEYVGGILKWLFTESGQAAVAGFFGGLSRWITFRETFVEGCASVFVGAITAYYMVPVIAPMLDKWLATDLEQSPQTYAATGYVIGVCGVLFIGGIIDSVRKWYALRRESDK